MRAKLGVCALVAVVAGGCDLGDGTGTLSGTLFLRGCTQDFDYGTAAAPAGYDMQPRYFVADPINALASAKPLHPVNKVNLRIQPSGNRQDEADALFINIGDDAPVAAALNTPIDVNGF